MANLVKDVFTVIKRENMKRGFWVKIGNAFENRDHSLTVSLNALPMDGRLIVRDRNEPLSGLRQEVETANEN